MWTANFRFFFFLSLSSLPVQGHLVPVNSMSNCASSLVLKKEPELSRIPDASKGSTKENQEPSKLLPFIFCYQQVNYLKLLPTTSCGHVTQWDFGLPQSWTISKRELVLTVYIFGKVVNLPLQSGLYSVIFYTFRNKCGYICLLYSICLK